MSNRNKVHLLLLYAELAFAGVCFFSYILQRTGEDGEVDLVLDVVHDRLPLLGRAALALFFFGCFERISGTRKTKKQQKQKHDANSSKKYNSIARNPGTYQLVGLR